MRKWALIVAGTFLLGALAVPVALMAQHLPLTGDSYTGPRFDNLDAGEISTAITIACLWLVILAGHILVEWDERRKK